MKFLIAGLGSIGRRHLSNLLKLGHHDIILYRTHHSTIPDEELNRFPVETNLEKALEHQPDGVIISNPTSIHLDVAIPAAEAGCHLFLEKPISHNLDRIDELKELINQKGNKVFVGYQFRFHPSLSIIRQTLIDGTIGKPYYVHSHWGEYLPSWHPWEDYRKGYSARADLGGGVTLTLSHPIDYLRWIIGDVLELWAITGKVGDLELEVEAIAEIGIRFNNDVLGSIHLDYLQNPPTHRLEIIGAHGTIRWDYSDNSIFLYRKGFDSWQIIPTIGNFDRNQLFINEIKHFINIINSEAEPICTLDDGIKALEIALAVHQSAKSGSIIIL
jgi:predicted dehydrogenase